MSAEPDEEGGGGDTLAVFGESVLMKYYRIWRQRELMRQVLLEHVCGRSDEPDVQRPA